MSAFKASVRTGPLLALGLFSAVSGTALMAQAAELTFQGPADENPSDEAIDWGNPDN